MAEPLGKQWMAKRLGSRQPSHCEVRASAKNFFRDKDLELSSSSDAAFGQGFYEGNGAKASPDGDMLRCVIRKSLKTQDFSLSLVGDRRLGNREI